MSDRLKIYGAAIDLAHKNSQTVGEDNDYYITLEQLEHILIQLISSSNDNN